MYFIRLCGVTRTVEWNNGKRIISQAFFQLKPHNIKSGLSLSLSLSLYIYIYMYVYIKAEQSRYRLGVAQRVPGSYGSQISWQRHRMVAGCQPYAPAAFTARKGNWYSFLLEAESTLCQWKIPMTSAGIEPATSRFVAQHLNHCATAVPHSHRT